MAILIVDDSSTMRKVLVTALKSIGFYRTIYQAENGEDAWNKLENGIDIEFIFLDWDMPVMNGYELLKKVRSQASYNDIPIMMITANGKKDDILKAVKAGISDYTVKPFKPDTIKKKLAHFFITYSEDDKFVRKMEKVYKAYLNNNELLK